MFKNQFNSYVDDVHHGTKDRLDLVLVELGLQLPLFVELGGHADDLVGVLLVVGEVGLGVELPAMRSDLEHAHVLEGVGPHPLIEGGDKLLVHKSTQHVGVQIGLPPRRVD